MFRRRVNPLRMLLAFAVAVAVAVAAPAVAVQRTFVASTGVDTNPCTLTQPCRGFAAAVSAVAANGEVVVLDSAGYGPVTLDKSVSLFAPKGIYAGVSVLTGTGILVAAGAGRVTLRGLTINGQGGNLGIEVVSVSVLELYDVEVSGLAATGILASNGGMIVGEGLNIRESGSEGILLAGGARMHLRNSRVENNQRGVKAQDGAWFSAVDTTFIGNYYEAILIFAGANQTAVLNLERCYVAENGHSFAAIKASTSDATARIDGTLSRNTITLNSGYGVIVGDPFAGEGHYTVNFVDNTITNNSAMGILIQLPQFDTTQGKIVLSGNTISRNDWGVGCNGAGVVTRGNNTIRDNVTNQLTCGGIVNEAGQ